jgi:hypothetical protein
VGSDQPLVTRSPPPLYISPQRPHTLVRHCGGQEPSPRLLTYRALIPSFIFATMSDIPDVILKNSDQRSLSAKAVAFQVATMAGISVCRSSS